MSKENNIVSLKKLPKWSWLSRSVFQCVFLSALVFLIDFWNLISLTEVITVQSLHIAKYSQNPHPFLSKTHPLESCLDFRWQSIPESITSLWAVWWRKKLQQRTFEMFSFRNIVVFAFNLAVADSICTGIQQSKHQPPSRQNTALSEQGGNPRQDAGSKLGSYSLQLMTGSWRWTSRGSRSFQSTLPVHHSGQTGSYLTVWGKWYCWS